MDSIIRLSLVGLAILLAAGCATAPAPTPTGPGPAAPQGYAGFDTWRYPGAEIMSVWADESPYEWVGYYLTAPCHRGTSWAGKRAEIERMGLGIAVLYVGQQLFENEPTRAELRAEADSTPMPADSMDPAREAGDTLSSDSVAPAAADAAAAEDSPIICSRTLLTADQARIDAADAIAKAAADGFPAGSTIYLDIERMSHVPPEMAEYYRVWIEELLRDGRYLPGTYAHHLNANDLFAIAQVAYSEAGDSRLPPFWIAGGSGFSLQAQPRHSGFGFAEVWQGILDVQRTFGGHTVNIDENVAARRNPSAPR